MKIAIISDIHSNLEALESVIDDIKTIAVDKIMSLGDNIGYGADPEQVINTIQNNNIVSVLGNHEYACLEDDYLLTFNKNAKKALLINKSRLSLNSLLYISNLKEFSVQYECRFVHGLPPEPVTKYVWHESKKELASIINSIPERISFVGHTHHLGLYEYCDGQVKTIELEKTKLCLDKNSSYIVNTGSVGQPRGFGIKAEYIIWNSEKRTIEPRYVEYDNKKAAKKIIQAGIPDIYSERIEKGNPFRRS